MFVTELDAIDELKTVLPLDSFIAVLKKPVERDQFVSKIHSNQCIRTKKYCSRIEEFSHTYYKGPDNNGIELLIS